MLQSGFSSGWPSYSGLKPTGDMQFAVRPFLQQMQIVVDAAFEHRKDAVAQHFGRPCCSGTGASSCASPRGDCSISRFDRPDAIVARRRGDGGRVGAELAGVGGQRSAAPWSINSQNDWPNSSRLPVNCGQ